MANKPFFLKDGTELTPELEARLAAEAESGYDLSKSRRIILRPGRPAKGEVGGESPRVAFRVPAEVYSSAKRRAEEDGVKLSEVVRDLLATYAAGAKPRRRGRTSHRPASSSRS
jgi:hypothetical protein